jgi:hypothetical protein
MKLWALCILFAFGSLALTAAPIPPGYTCTGNCGTLGANGVVTASPQGGVYQYVSTQGSGLSDDFDLNIGDETNGSYLTSPTFAANAGAALEFYFNYVTSDGAEFTEYAWAELIDTSDDSSIILFTARTTTSGDTVPGNGLPGLAPGVTLTPASTPIIAGGPDWSPLGDSSGECYDVGCGYTGWIRSDYTIPTAGNYRLAFGVVNWLDEDYDSGLAVDGLVVDGVDIGEVPEPSTFAMLGLGAGLLLLRARQQKKQK